MAYISFQPSDYFNTVLYTGNGSTQSITGVGFQPDWIWQKARNQTYDHRLFDAVRGTTKAIYSNTSGSEGTESGVTAFDSDGFSLGSNAGSNGNTVTYASWNWKANGQGSANSDGSITTTYTSANTTSGFSIVSYTGNATTGATIGHGLGVTPKMIIVKNRTDASTDWVVYHESLGNTNGIYLNLTSASGAVGAWNSTSPTSSVFTVNNANALNGSGDSLIAYCFAEKKGFSKFGSYTGNGNADGTFIYTGFKPAFVICKMSSASGQNWELNDNKRNPYNEATNTLRPNTNDAEDGTFNTCDLLSNGFKLRTSNDATNKSSFTYIYMAFAEHPLVSSNDIPATAR